MKVRARVFTLGEDQFLLPGVWYAEDDSAVGLGDPMTVMTEALLFAVMLGARTHGWLEIEADDATGQGNLPNVTYRLTGRQFEHGAIDVLLIAGPLYDAAVRNNLGGELCVSA